MNSLEMAFAIAFAIGFVIGAAFGSVVGLLFGSVAGGAIIGGVVVGFVTGIVGVALFFVWKALGRNQQIAVIAAFFILSLFFEPAAIIALVGGAYTVMGIAKRGGR